MEFWPDENRPPNQLTLNKIKLPMVNNIKFLGVIIDNTLTWNIHINNVIKKIFKTNKNLIGVSKNLLSTEAKLKIYFAHIHSHLIYANTIWSSCLTKKNKLLIKKKQKYCV